ncbi:drebrin-like protein B [Osmerus mordax]|uniref:drebrin-like protein B n=1 Tax=Osmerus mordax TaxID=8014 RepID=UPI00350F3DB1
MAVNLSKNGAALTAAYKEVVDSKLDTNWALFTYEGNSNDIRLADKGAGGLEEMVEELSSGKVMYAFCKVQVLNSSLPKFVFINWTGEGVRDSRKALCANHVSSMATFLKGAHVTINARAEEDVDPETILNKVAKASGANYNFNKESSKHSDVPRGSVGSVYQKTNALEEIQKTNKDNFWAQSQRDEEARRQDDSRRAEEDRQRTERETKERDELEAAQRDCRAKERASVIDQQKSYQKQQETEVAEQQRQQTEQQERVRKPAWGIHSAASVQKANEAASLISQRSFNPKEVFIQRDQSAGLNNGSATFKPGKLQSPFLSQKSTEREAPSQPLTPAPLLPKNTASPVPTPSPASPVPTPSPASPVPTPSPAISASPVPALSPVVPASPVPALSPALPASPVPALSPVLPASPVPALSPALPASPVPALSPALPASPVPALSPASPVPSPSPVPLASSVAPASPVQPEEAYAEEEYWSDDFDVDADDAAQERPICQDDLYSGTQEVAGTGDEGGLYEDVCQITSTVEELEGAGFEKGTCARALYDYQAADDSEITFDPDDIISGIEMVDEGWWRGFGPDGHYGMFPANYVQLL